MLGIVLALMLTVPVVILLGMALWHEWRVRRNGNRKIVKKAMKDVDSEYEELCRRNEPPKSGLR